MKNRNRFVIIAIIIVSCAVMAAVETIIEPIYIVKSPIKFIAFIRLSSYVPRKAAFLFSSVMFSIYHVAFIGPSFPWQMLILALVGLTAGGLIFDLIDAKSGNICPSWFVHMFAGLSLMTILYMHI